MRTAIDKMFRLFRSETANTVPPAADLLRGELFVNLFDQKLFTKDQADEVIELAPSEILFNEYSDTAGVTTWTEAQLGKGRKWGLTADTTTGIQTHELPDAWLTPGKELTINRVGNNDLIVRVGDGTIREIVGDLTGANLQVPGIAVFKVLSDNSIVVTTPIPHGGAI